jgi:hypothetical protein
MAAVVQLCNVNSCGCRRRAGELCPPEKIARGFVIAMLLEAFGVEREAIIEGYFVIEEYVGWGIFRSTKRA